MPLPAGCSVEQTLESPARSDPQRQRLAHLERAVTQTEKRLSRLSQTTTERLAGVSLCSNLRYTLHPLQRGSSDGAGEEVSPSRMADVGLTPAIMQTRLEGTCGGVSSSNALARIDALEAHSDNLRHGIQDAFAMAESTKTLLKAAMGHEVEQLWHELRLLRMQSTAELQRVEKSGAEALQRGQEAARQIEARHQEQLAGESSLKDAHDQERLAEVGLQLTRQKEGPLQDLHALRESGLNFREYEAESVEQTQHVVDHVHELVEDITERVQDLEQQRHRQAAEVAVLHLRLQEFEGALKQQHADHVSQPVEEILLRVQDMEQQLHRQAAESEMLQLGLQEVKHSQQRQSADIVAAQVRQEQAMLELVHSARESRLASMRKCEPEEQQGSSIDFHKFTNRLLVLEGKILRSDGEEAAFATTSDIEQLHKSLAETNNDVSMLARNFARVICKAAKFSVTETSASQASSNSLARSLHDTVGIQRKQQSQSSPEVSCNRTNQDGAFANVTDAASADAAVKFKHLPSAAMAGSSSDVAVGINYKEQAKAANNISGLAMFTQKMTKQELLEQTKVELKDGLEERTAQKNTKQ